jgi:hypothetical protein
MANQTSLGWRRDQSAAADLTRHAQQLQALTLPAETAMSSVGRALVLKPEGLRKLRAVLRDATHKTTVALREIGVEYVVRGAGRGAKSFLVKHAVR